MNSTLTELIANALIAHKHVETMTAVGALIQDDQDANQLALNALTERLNEIIDERITQML